MRTFWPRHLVIVAAAAALATTSAVASAQGTLTGRVTAQGTGEPLQEARVLIVGTSLVTTTGPDGRYTLRRIPAGTAEVRVIRIGFNEQKRSVAVLDGQTATLDFAMGVSVVQLNEVVSTATGDQRRLEIGNAVSNISVATIVQSQPVHNLNDVLNARVPGVMVTSGTQTGTGARIRIRGISSISLSNDPIYVIDGIRMTSNNSSFSFGTGGNNPSRVNDLTPEEIENIEIVKGPSAATLYGTDAANGVIVITTKKGRAGQARWSTFVEGGILQDRHEYPTNYTLAGHGPTGSLLIQSGQCTLPMVSARTCIVDSVRTLNVMAVDSLTPLGLGSRVMYGAQLSAGTEAFRYFLSADREEETGVFKLPDFEQKRYDSLGVTPHEWTKRPNALQKNAFRANLNLAVNPQLDLGVNVGYTNLDSRYSLESNATAGVGSQAFGGPGYVQNGTVAGTGAPLMGYRAWTPAYTWEERRGQGVHRLILSSNADWRPTSWLHTRANVGTDLTERSDNDLRLRGEAPPLNSTYRLGFAGNSATNIRNLSVDLGSTANFNPSWMSSANLKTTVGIQYSNYRSDNAEASGQDLPPGAQTPSAAASPSADASTTLQRTLGVFVEQAVAFRDRLFLTAAIRSDQNSAFGTNFQRVMYPKLSASWVLSDEDFFPATSLLSNLRFRLAYGASGVQPGPNDAKRTYQATTTNVKAVDAAALQFSAIGNADLKPERSSEIETGFDMRLLENRATFEITYYRRKTHDALISAIVPPSLGAATSVRRNLGSIQNGGWEGLISATPIEHRHFGFDFTLAMSANDNKVISLGDTPPQIGTSTRIVEGYPIRGLWERKISGWDDKNNDGILTYDVNPALNEVFVDDSASYIDYSQPRYQVAFTPGVDLFNRRVRLQSVIDYRGGAHWYNNTERIRCVSRQNCNGRNNPAASFEEQAMVVATLDHPSKTIAGFFQPGAFVRWREFSALAALPTRWLRGTGAREANIVFAARNLGFFSKYRGTDPESDFTASEGGDSPSEFQTFAIPTYYTVRVNVRF